MVRMRWTPRQGAMTEGRRSMRSLPRNHSLFLLPCSLLLIHCAPVEAPRGAQRADSAGVAIVHYDALPDASGNQVTLSGEPVLTIGGAGAAPEQEFSGIAGVVRLSDGRIVVADGGSGELRYFDSQGKLLGKSGGPGQGPGEFRRLSFVGRLAGDSILTGDAAIGRFQVFDPEGRYVRGMSTTETGGCCSWIRPGTVGTPSWCCEGRGN